MKTSEAAKGKWLSILTMMGIDEYFLDGKHHACPNCGGKDRFRFDDKNGNGDYFCSGCNAGNGFDLLQKINGWDFKTTAKRVDELVGQAIEVKPRPKRTLNQIRSTLNNIRKRLSPISQSKSACDYFFSRGISEDTLKALVPEIGVVIGMEYWQAGKIEHRFDTIACRMKKLGKPISYHLTYTKDGKKAPVKIQRKVMTPTENKNGSVVQLFDHSHELGIAEGIETAMSAYQGFGIPTWAALDCNSMKEFVVPQGVTKLYIFGDNDENQSGQIAAQTLKEKAEFAGIEVVVNIPSLVGEDWNDVLMADQKQAKDHVSDHLNKPTNTN